VTRTRETNSGAPRAILWITAVGTLGFGAAFTLWPEQMARLFDISLTSSTAKIDFAATYGGFELGFGAFLVACARRRDWVEVGLWAGAAALAGFAVVRLLTLLASAGKADSVIYIALGIEVTGLVLNVGGLWVWRQAHEGELQRSGPEIQAPLRR
jgi:uncharacterized membrane protein YgdD (TMEM256/DUF423 family)